jgi:hypothetical protein
MPVARYTCTACGLATRCEQGADHRICNCEAPYDEELEEEPGGA